jgi:hypothetical protein
MLNARVSLDSRIKRFDVCGYFRYEWIQRPIKERDLHIDSQAQFVIVCMQTVNQCTSDFCGCQLTAVVQVPVQVPVLPLQRGSLASSLRHIQLTLIMCIPNSRSCLPAKDCGLVLVAGDPCIDVALERRLDCGI